MKRIGIDVGGTNTDAVLMDGMDIRASIKSATSADIFSGVVTSLEALLAQVGPGAAEVDAVVIGTTQFTNAVVQRGDLIRVAAIRICLPSCASLAPMVDWPDDLRDLINPMSFLVAGGHEYDGQQIVPLDERAIRDAAAKIRDAGIRAVGICGVFSPLNAEFELRAAEILREICPDVSVSLSHTLGRIGLLERENVTLLNACLSQMSKVVVAALESAILRAGIRAPFYLTQNDGTITRASVAAQYPVYSFASGPTNSMRGAALMTGIKDAMVCDVGGTTSDIGCIHDGFPRQANNVVRVGGVRTLFRMPDLVSVALGGGTLVSPDGHVIGPRSVGYRLTQEALAFGGATLTTTDIAVAAGLADIGERARVAGIPASTVRNALDRIRVMLEDASDRMKPTADPMPMVVVGGGAFLVPDRLAGFSEVLHVPNAGVANAVGAAISQVSGEVDQIFSGISRDAAMSEAEAIAVGRAVEAGADPASISTIEAEDLPVAYLPGDARRVRLRVVGDIRPGWNGQIPAPSAAQGNTARAPGSVPA